MNLTKEEAQWILSQLNMRVFPSGLDVKFLRQTIQAQNIVEAKLQMIIKGPEKAKTTKEKEPKNGNGVK